MCSRVDKSVLGILLFIRARAITFPCLQEFARDCKEVGVEVCVIKCAGGRANCLNEGGSRVRYIGGKGGLKSWCGQALSQKIKKCVHALLLFSIFGHGNMRIQYTPNT